MIPECCTLDIPDEAWRQSRPGGIPSRLTASVTINGVLFIAVAAELPLAETEHLEDAAGLYLLGVDVDAQPRTLRIDGRDFVVYLVPEAR